MKWQKILISIGLLLLCESFAIAQNNGSGNGTAQPPQKKLEDLVKPVIDFFGKPLHPTVSQVAPGGGISRHWLHAGAVVCRNVLHFSASVRIRKAILGPGREYNLSSRQSFPR